MSPTIKLVQSFVQKKDNELNRMMIYTKKERKITAMPLVFDAGNSATCPPVDGGWEAAGRRISEAPIATCHLQPSPELTDPGPSIECPELVIGHVAEPVELKLVGGTTLLIERVHKLGILLEKIEPLVLLVVTSRYVVVASPPVVQSP